MKDYLYHYSAVVTQVYDGDSVTLDIDIGLYTWKRGVKARLYGIDTPELRGSERKEGLEARDYLQGLVLGKPVVVQTIKDKTGKYGRWLVVLWLDGANINEALVESGYAEYREY